ncbi:MAG TPA: ribbon-helix-helix protein, CopG family [Thermoanaerobaculia bacterium]|nr:ribbon-helix-helix protein, CopG family [Thermoanaerobaculia bacterium]
MARKVTFTLDDKTVQRIESVAARLRKAKSAVVREAVADYHDRVGRLSEAEKQRLLKVVREVVPAIPTRSARDVDRELDDLRAARRIGGRQRTGKARR